MQNLKENKYKESSPLATTHRARTILDRLGMGTQEIRWFVEGRDYHSLRVELSGSGHGLAMDGIGTNGKGTDAAYAQASAYAEFMERLENGALFPMPFSDADNAHGGFFLFPDEIYVSAEEILEDGGRERFILPELSPSALAEYLEKAAALTPRGCPGEFIAVPYLETESGKTRHFPICFLRNCFTTTGMSAGNTTAEALVQAISEIFERYAMLQIETEEITPPTIPHEYIGTHMPRIREMIETLEEGENRLRVVIKDCSLGRGIPAYAALLIFPNTQRYFVNFGAHPVAEIAIERCLTEFLQGVPVAERARAKRLEYSYFEKFDTDNMYNHAENLVTCDGYYPNRLFAPTPTYAASEAPPRRYDSNEAMLDHLAALVEEMGKGMFVRDNAFLGFPAVSVIIPGLSQTHVKDADFVFPHLMGNDADYARALSIVRDIRAAGEEELSFLADFLQDRPAAFTVCELFSGLFSEREIFPAYAKPASYMEALVHLRLGRYRDAYMAMDDYVEFLREGGDADLSGAEMVKSRCARDLFGTRADGLSEADTLKALTLFFDEEIVRAVLAEFGTAEDIFNDFPNFPCHDCERCASAPICRYPAAAPLYRRVKSAHGEGLRGFSEMTPLFPGCGTRSPLAQEKN